MPMRKRAKSHQRWSSVKSCASAECDFTEIVPTDYHYRKCCSCVVWFRMRINTLQQLCSSLSNSEYHLPNDKPIVHNQFLDISFWWVLWISYNCSCNGMFFTFNWKNSRHQTIKRTTKHVRCNYDLLTQVCSHDGVCPHCFDCLMHIASAVLINWCSYCYATSIPTHRVNFDTNWTNSCRVFDCEEKQSTICYFWTAQISRHESLSRYTFVE